MAEEVITILKVGTDEAVKSVNDLRSNIKELKSTLGELEIGTEEYAATAQELAVNQNALKDAMYGSTASIEELSSMARGASESYNGLVHQMAALKTELRNVDVSTEEGKARFAELAQEINGVNDRLKEMDAMQGSYVRNVGNYTSALDGLGGVLQKLPPTMGKMKDSMGKVGQTMKMVGQQPILGIIGLLAPILSKIVNALKGNATAMAAVDKAMAALQPVFDLVAGVLQKIAEVISKVIGKFTDMAGESGGTFKKIISAAIGVGNTLVQFLLTPIRTIINAFKGLGNIIKDVFTGDFKKIKEHAADAWNGIKDSFSKGFDFKENFAAGQKMAESILGGAASKKGEAKDTGRALGKSLLQGALEEIEKGIEKEIEALEKGDEAMLAELNKAETERNKAAAAKAKERLDLVTKNAQQEMTLNDILTEDAREKEAKKYEITLRMNERRLDLLKQFADEALSRGDLTAYLDYQQQSADLSVEIENNALREKKRLREQDIKSAEAAAAANLATMQGLASGVGSLLTGIADAYEESGDESEASAKRIKGLRIASATIDTITGATGAFMQAAASLPFPYGVIIGAVQAAAVTAAGVANIAKIKATQVGSGGDSSSGATSSASVTAPAVTADVQSVRNVTTATEEDRLDAMAGSQKVYILNSDIEASQKSRRVKVRESSF